jgi:di/tricarboxylate transporter
VNRFIGFMFVNVVWLLVCVASFIAGVWLSNAVKGMFGSISNSIGKLFGSGGSM